MQMFLVLQVVMGEASHVQFEWDCRFQPRPKSHFLHASTGHVRILRSSNTTVPLRLSRVPSLLPDFPFASIFSSTYRNVQVTSTGLTKSREVCPRSLRIRRQRKTAIFALSHCLIVASDQSCTSIDHTQATGLPITITIGIQGAA